MDSGRLLRGVLRLLGAVLILAACVLLGQMLSRRLRERRLFLRGCHQGLLALMREIDYAASPMRRALPAAAEPAGPAAQLFLLAAEKLAASSGCTAGEAWLEALAALEALQAETVGLEVWGELDRHYLGEVVFPLLRRTLLAAAILVFVDVMKEIPLTLSLRPFNFDTLATKAYQLANDEMLAESAPAATAAASAVAGSAGVCRFLRRPTAAEAVLHVGRTVDADLQQIERAEFLDPLGDEHPVRVEFAPDAAALDVPDDFTDIVAHERLSAGERDQTNAAGDHLVDHVLDGGRIEFVDLPLILPFAVMAVKIAASGDQPGHGNRDASSGQLVPEYGESHFDGIREIHQSYPYRGIYSLPAMLCSTL